MKNLLRTILVLLMLLALIVLVPSGGMVAQAEIVEFPRDVKVGGLEPQADGYLSEWEYEDPSISVKIEKGRMYDTDYMFARVKIANPTQLRTAFAYRFSSKDLIVGSVIATRMKAVFATSGDFYTDRNGLGYVNREGVEYRKYCDRKYDNKWHFDVLLMDEKGDLHILKEATNADIDAFEGTIVNGWTFGPGLVIDGVRQTDFPNTNNGPTRKAQRTCLAQVGPLEYLCVTCEGPEDPGSKGMTLEEFTDLICSFEGVQNAYNLDGGSTSTFVFRGAKVNAPRNPKKRTLPDIIYFASAYVPDAEATEAPAP